MPKKLIVVDATTNKPTGVVKFTFEDQTEQELDVNSLSDDMKLRLMLHGLSQKAGDSYAGAKNEPKPVEFAKESVAAVFAQLRNNDWRAASSAGPRVTDLATVFAQVNGITVEDAIEFLEASSEDDIKAIKAKPRIKAGLAAITAQRAAEKAAKALKDAEAAEAAEKASVAA